jgi:hypothetical protein
METAARALSTCRNTRVGIVSEIRLRAMRDRRRGGCGRSVMTEGGIWFRSVIPLARTPHDVTTTTGSSSGTGRFGFGRFHQSSALNISGAHCTMDD